MSAEAMLLVVAFFCAMLSLVNLGMAIWFALSERFALSLFLMLNFAFLGFLLQGGVFG